MLHLTILLLSLGLLPMVWVIDSPAGFPNKSPRTPLLCHTLVMHLTSLWATLSIYMI